MKTAILIFGLQSRMENQVFVTSPKAPAGIIDHGVTHLGVHHSLKEVRVPRRRLLLGERGALGDYVVNLVSERLSVLDILSTQRNGKQNTKISMMAQSAHHSIKKGLGFWLHIRICLLNSIARCIWYSEVLPTNRNPRSCIHK